MESIDVRIQEMGIDEAKSMGQWLFGEKYGDIVRVVKYGSIFYRIMWWYSCK